MMAPPVRLRTISALLLLAPAAAHGAPFDDATGKISLSSADFGLSFDGFSPDVPLLMYSPRFMPLGEQALAELLVTSEERAIEGTGTFHFGGLAAFGYLDLRSIGERFAGRRVELRIWQRARGTAADLSLLWLSGPVEDLLSGQWSRVFQLGEVPFQPTGRGTDDGWREWSSGPVDFSIGGELPAQLIRVLDSQLRGAGQGLAAYNPELFVELDALSIEDLGPAAVPSVACRLLDEAARCGREGACAYGRCVDAAAVLGPMLQNPVFRRDYVTRRAFELRSFEGGRAPVAQMERLAGTFDRLHGDVSTAEYWDLLIGAVAELGDGHASAPIGVYNSQVHAGVCMYLGEADLLPGGGEAPLVFEASRDNPIGDALQPGDVLVAIDDVAVREWAASATRYFSYPGDPLGREVAITSELFGAALKTGALLRFARCSPGPSGEPCTEASTRVFEVDLSTAVSGLWRGEPPSWRLDHRTCDFRFHRAIEAERGREYEFAGFADEDGLRQLQFNGVPSPYGRGGEAWFQTIDDALASPPAQLILDERLGGGGSIEAVDHLMGYLLAPEEVHGMELLPQLEPEADAGVRRTLRECSRLSPQYSFVQSCGNAFEWRLAENHPRRATASTSSVAVLIGLDVSGNDYVTRLMQFRTRGATRIFGPAPTYGAFGVVWRLPAVAGELFGGSFQVHDTLFLATEDEAPPFSTGFGVAPDVRVLQKQSDAVRGVDTVFSAARRWLGR